MIFADNAGHYWKRGLPAIPLIAGQKRPAVSGWQVFGEKMPDADQQAAWLRHFPEGNIGMPLGPQSGMVAVDIDTDDPRALRVIELLLPPTPWTRVGKKGSVRMYRYSGERSARIGGAEGMICEILSKGTQVVLPPSIHPDTKVPYRANAELWEVAGALPPLPPGFDEMLRGALRDAGLEVSLGSGNKVVSFVPAGQRDNRMVWHSGVLARAVTRGERTLLQALGEMQAWAESYVENVVGDEIDWVKGQKKIVEFIVRDVMGPRKMTLPEGWDEGLTEQMKDQLGITFGEDHQRWSGNRVLEYLTEQFMQHQEILCDAQLHAINMALKRIAREDSGLTVLDEERILKFINAQTAGQLPLAALRRQVKEMKTEDLKGENHEEIARAVQAFVDDFGELRYDAGDFWQWRGSHWEIKPEGELIKLVAEEFGYYPTCRKQSDYSQVVKLLRSTTAKPLKQLDIGGINFANGFLTEDMQLLEHSPDFGKTYVLPYRYVPDVAGNMPLFNRYLMDSWGSDPDCEDKILALQEAIGATLFAVAPMYQRAICLFGEGGSGKSTLSQIVRSMVPPEAVSSVPPHEWDDTFLPAQMHGKLLNFAGELSEKRQIAGEKFKQIVEGEIITAQHKLKPPFQFRPLCAQWFNSNHLPKTSDTSSGFNRRWLFLQWTKSVPAEKKIIGLHKIIADTEREAIVAWGVQGYERLKKQGDYTLPASHHELTEQMAMDNNTVRYFLAQTPLLVMGEGVRGSMRMNDLYNEYWSFCLAMGVAKRVTSNTFVAMMKDLQQRFGFVVESKSQRGGVEVLCRHIMTVEDYKRVERVERVTSSSQRISSRK